MVDVGLVKKEFSSDKTRNKTYYVLSSKGLKTNKILYDLTYFSLTELDGCNLDENFKNELFFSYCNCLNI